MIKGRRVEFESYEVQALGHRTMGFAWRALPYFIIAGALWYGGVKALDLIEGGDAHTYAAETGAFAAFGIPLSLFVSGLIISLVGKFIHDTQARKAPQNDNWH